MYKVWLPLSLLVATAALAGVDRYGYSTQEIDEAVFSSVTMSTLAWPRITQEIRALSPAARAEAVKMLGVVARATFESQAFRSRYDGYVKDYAPEAPKPRRSYTEILADYKKQVAQQKTDFDKVLAVMSAADQKTARKNFAEGIAMQDKFMKNREMLEGQEQARYDDEKERYDEDVARYPKDPTTLLKPLLQRFLDETRDVDYAAQLKKGDDERMYFVKPDYETKPDIWKTAFRAGKEATTAARDFAVSWQRALK